MSIALQWHVLRFRAGTVVRLNSVLPNWRTHGAVRCGAMPAVRKARRHPGNAPAGGVPSSAGTGKSCFLRIASQGSTACADRCVTPRLLR